MAIGPTPEPDRDEPPDLHPSADADELGMGYAGSVCDMPAAEDPDPPEPAPGD